MKDYFAHDVTQCLCWFEKILAIDGEMQQALFLLVGLGNMDLEPLNIKTSDAVIPSVCPKKIN